MSQNFRLLMENWNEFLNERDASFTDKKAPKDGASYEELKANWEEFKQRMLSISDVWIFFDTETTGLDDKAESTQVTELAAGAYDFSKWFADGTKPEKLVIGNIPLMLKPVINNTSEFSTKVKLTDKVKMHLAREKSLMRVKNKKSSLHIKYAEAEMNKMSSKEAFRKVEEMAKQDSTLQTGKGKTKELTQKGWQIWRQAKEEALSRLTPEDVPLYSETHTDNPKEMGYGAGSKSGTLVALLTLGKYGSGKAPFKRDAFVYNAFSQYLELIKNESGREYVGLMAHNAPFDVKQMNAAYEKAGLVPYDKSVFDSIEVFRKYLVPIVKDTINKINSGKVVDDRSARLAGSMGKKNKAGKNMISVSLGPVVKGFDLPDLGWHAAIADVRMTAMMFIEALDYIDNWFRQVEESPVEQEPVGDDLEQEPAPAGDQSVPVDRASLGLEEDRNTLYENVNFKRRPLLKTRYRR